MGSVLVASLKPSLCALGGLSISLAVADSATVALKSFGPTITDISSVSLSPPSGEIIPST